MSVTSDEMDDENLITEDVPDSTVSSRDERLWKFHTACIQISSSSLDAQSPYLRKKSLEDVYAMLRQDLDTADNNATSASCASILIQEYRNFPCTSIHAIHRMVSIYVEAINLLQEKVCEVDGEDVKIDAPGPGKDLEPLLLRLCHFLRRSRNASWIFESARKLCRSDHLIAASWIAYLTSALLDMAKRMAASNANVETEERLLLPTQCALGFAMESIHETVFDSIHSKWIPLLVEHTTTQYSKFTEFEVLESRKPHWGLLSCITTTEWTTLILPTLLIKLKSHPDRTLSTLYGWIHESNSLGRSDLLPTISMDFISLLTKHLISDKEENRNLAHNILITWATTTVGDENSPTSFESICHALSSIQPIPTLAIARSALYRVLEELAIQYLYKRSTTALKEIDSGTIEGALSSLYTILQKETKIEHRVVGLHAILEWMIVTKESNTELSAPTSYRTVITELIQKPIQTSQKISDVALPFVTLLVERLLSNGDLLHAIVNDIWILADKTWEKALEGVVTSCASKKSMQPDGVVIVYLALVAAAGSSQTSNKHFTIPLFIQKLVTAGNCSVDKVTNDSSFFLYSQSMMELITSNRIVSSLLPLIIRLYLRMTTVSTTSNGKEMLTLSFCSASQKPTCLSHVLALCSMTPFTITTAVSGSSASERYASSLITASLKEILSIQPSAMIPIVDLLLQQIDRVSNRVYDVSRSGNATREARENENVIVSIPKFLGGGFDSNVVRSIARMMASEPLSSLSFPEDATQCTSDSPSFVWVRFLVLSHVGTTLHKHSSQRRSVVDVTIIVLRTLLRGHSNNIPEWFCQAMAAEILHYVQGSTSEQAACFSGTLHRAALSLLLSLGTIAAMDPETDEIITTFCHVLCVSHIAPLLSAKLGEVLQSINSLSMSDVDVFRSPIGKLYRTEKVSSAIGVVKAGGKRLTEEEEWELQVKEELAKKKNNVASVGGSISPEDVKLLEEQDIQRRRVSSLIDVDYVRALDAIRYFCMSDIEVGNECLPLFGDAVLSAAVSTSPAANCVASLRRKAVDVLTSLSGCVYEIDENLAPAIATALLISHRNATTGEVSALPSHCPSASSVIIEMDQYGDTLSGSSFVFLFPIIQAALFGPRSAAGCEGALKVLHKHTEMLYGDSMDQAVVCIRKEMAVAVLQLLKHDRAQTFHDPLPMETLAACYLIVSDGFAHGSALSVAELAPLLDERGALGSRNCRIGAMYALSEIAKVHSKMLQTNLLLENRVWLNCFDRDHDIKIHARKAWALIHDMDEDELLSDDTQMPRPSPLYAPPLLSLLSHSDASIAQAAADAYARAMAMHTNSVSRNIEFLCKTYIDSFPSPDDSVASNASPSIPSAKAKPQASMVPATKKITVGLPKPKAPPKSALEVAGIGKPKAVTKKKTTVSSALLKPKQERTLDAETLAGQFKATAVVASEKKEKDSPDKIAVRKGVLCAIAAFSSSGFKVEMDQSSLRLLTSFLMAYGIADLDDEVKSLARDTLRDVVASNGGSDEAISFLLPHLEAVLNTGAADESALGSLPKDKVPKSVLAADRRKEGAVVSLGSVALHLQGPENDAKVESTVDMLINALKTPSEEVQVSVAEALTKLMKKGKNQERIESLLSDLLKSCLHGESLALRRGAAYGLAAAVKGSGITTLKKFEIVKKLEEACSTGNTNSKEGSLFAIELLSSRLGLLFEPYVIVLLPSLLKAFSDNSDHVRTAANNTAGLIMSKLSAHGVKLVMPAVLTAFNDPAWRTKQASIHMLGAMSHLAPKQLASALPKVVPQLTEAFSDTHAKVKASAQEALHEISTVVKNPEISSICPILLKALTDPADHTVKALEALIGTEFLHAIDAPSLALIVPILHRGLRDRGATTKRSSGLIAGNICTMINDPKDFVPYLPTLLPDLQSSLLDPIPDVRSTSAKALGSLTRSLGELILLELRPWLIERLRDENCSSAERSGAAQGLTEVLIASGTSMVEGTMRSEILPLRSHPSAGTREGVLWMLIFLPPALGQGFTPLIDVSLPALINGLSDDSEPVRDVALRAGRVLIRSHGKVHVDKILPSLEAGLSSDDHRIRVASLWLLGDLLSLIGGTHLAKGESDTQDDRRKAERAQAQIALTLGAEARRRVLSGLYIARSDSVHAVRQSAIDVWKTVVSVTVRALRDILPVLVNKIIDDLASGHYEKTEIAGRCLGDVVSKLGDSVLPQIIPVLRKALYEGDEHTKRGVCVGLTEVIQCSDKDPILRFIEIIMPVVRDALSDDSEVVRKMAATCFQSLHSVVGSRAMDEVVPSFMVALESGEHDEVSRMRALNGLTGILGVRSRELLPYIIPRLIKRPITANQAEILAGIAQVTGGTIHFHFSAIIPAILNELSDAGDKDAEKVDALRSCSTAICGSVESTGVNWLVSEIASKCGSDKATLRRESCRMLECLIVERSEKEDFYDQIPVMIREMLYRLNDDNASVLKANHAALTALSNKVQAEELVQHVEFMKNLIANMVSEARRRKGGVGDGEFLLPGFNMPKGVEPLIPVYQRGILYGSPTIREVSAAGLGELIDFTASAYLSGPLMVKMTGPLLRIVGDRNLPTVKIAILQTLQRILQKGGVALRAFVPQFQTTFVKALSDPSRQVRVEAIASLSLLMPLSTRVDPLIKELVSGALGKSSTFTVTEGVAASTAIQTATLEALAAVLEQGGSKVKSTESLDSALEASKQLLSNPDEGIREGAAKVLGRSCALLGMDVTKQELESLMEDSSSESTLRHGRACAIHRILESSVGSKMDPALMDQLRNVSVSFIKDDKSQVREAGYAALGATMGHSSTPKSTWKACESDWLSVLRDTRETIEIHRAVARGLCIALSMLDPSVRIQVMGINLLDACLAMALKSSQRVQLAFYDVLYLALNVSEEGGDTGGLNRYCEMAVFDNQRSMKSLHTKVLSRIKGITILDR